MKLIINLLRIKLQGVSPEAKFFIVRLYHLSGCGVKIIKEESVDVLVKKLSVSLKSALEGIRFLEVNGFIVKKKNWLRKEKLSNIEYEFTSEFTAMIDSESAGDIAVEICEWMAALLMSSQLNNLSKRAAVKLFLLTLLAHADKFGVVRNLSIKDFNELIGRFSSDRHRSQLTVLKGADFVSEYSGGMSGGILLGKQKSEYLVNIHHPVWHENKSLKKLKSVVVKVSLNDNLLVACRLSHVVRIIQKKDIHSGDVSSSIKQLMMDILTEEEIASSEGPHMFYDAINAAGNVFDGDVRAFQIQRYISKLAMELLREPDWELQRASIICRHLKFDEMFSDKFLREVLVSEVNNDGGEKLKQKPLKEQIGHYEKLEAYMSIAINQRYERRGNYVFDSKYDEKISAVSWLISRCVISSARKYHKFLKENSELLSELPELVIFQGKKEMSLHFLI